jgi:hypothetical protein
MHARWFCPVLAFLALISGRSISQAANATLSLGPHGPNKAIDVVIDGASVPACSLFCWGDIKLTPGKHVLQVEWHDKVWAVCLPSVFGLVVGPGQEVFRTQLLVETVGSFTLIAEPDQDYTLYVSGVPGSAYQLKLGGIHTSHSGPVLLQGTLRWSKGLPAGCK